jgi:flavorubredoxin
MADKGRPFQAVQVSETVYWVGSIDWGLRYFHGYSTIRGTTYNAYLVMADKVTLIDTVRAPHVEEMMSRVASVVDPREVEYIVSNHSEMDHSGELPRAIEAMEPSKVFASRQGVKALDAHMGLGGKLTAVSDGEELDLGGRTLTFVSTPMLHWPDSMFSYMPEEELLFSQDGFGMHLASSQRFADEIDPGILFWEASKYYANILLVYSMQVERLMERVAKAALKFRTICPDHGPIWRKDPEKVIGWYAKWAAQKPEKRAVVFYDTMWHSCEKLGEAAAEGLIQAGVPTTVMPLDSNNRSDVMTEVMLSGAIVVGSPTLNSQIFPTVSDVLTYVRGLRPKNKVGAVYGSYGWSGESVKILKSELERIGVDLVADDLKVQYVPTEADLLKAVEMGRTVGEELKKRCAGS